MDSKAGIIVVFVFCLVGLGLGWPSDAVPENRDIPIDLRPAVDNLIEFIELDSVLSTFGNIHLVSCISSYDPIIMKFLHSEEFRKIHYFVWTHPSYLEIISFIATGGFPEIYETFNQIYEYFGLPYRVDEFGPIDPISDLEPKNTIPEIPINNNPCDLHGYIEKIRVSIPEQELVGMIYRLYKTDPSVKAMLKLVTQEDKMAFFKELMNMSEVKRVIEYAESKGLATDELMPMLN